MSWTITMSDWILIVASAAQVLATRNQWHDDRAAEEACLGANPERLCAECREQRAHTLHAQTHARLRWRLRQLALATRWPAEWAAAFCERARVIEPYPHDPYCALAP